MDIDERAERWADEWMTGRYFGPFAQPVRDGLIEAYLAGVGQARVDETNHVYGRSDRGQPS